MKKIAVITTTKELKEFQERTDIKILDINVKSCDQTWATQEYFVATIVYDDDLSSGPNYWTKLEHQAAIAAMQGILGNPNIIYKDISTETICNHVAERVKEIAHALVEKMKEKEERK